MHVVVILGNGQAIISSFSFAKRSKFAIPLEIYDMV